MQKLPYFIMTVALTGSMMLLASAKKPDAAKGKEVFDQCSVCHNADSTDKKIGPGLKGLFKHDKLVNGKAVNEANVRAKIDEGGNGMPGYKDILSDQERADVIAYLKSI